MKELVLLGVGVTGRPYLAAAEALGVRVRAVETESWPAGGVPDVQRIAGMGDDRREVDEAWAQGAYQVLVEQTPDGILAFSEPHVLAAALAQDRLGLPGPSLHAAVVSRNKALQRACFGAHGLPQPQFLVAADAHSGAGWAAERLPVVVKPLSSFGSTGVELVTDHAKLRAIAEARRGAGRVLFETAVDGPEYSWEAFVAEGRVLFGNFTAKETTGPPNFVEVVHRCGHSFGDERVRRRVDELAAAAVGALGVRSGLVHLEFRLGADGPVLIEVAVRTPGDHLMDLVAMTYGFDPYEIAVRLALGMPVDVELPSSPTAYAAIWYPVCLAGEVVSVEGLDEVAGHPAVARVALKVKAGDTVRPIESSGQRIGFIIIRGRTPQERDEAMRIIRGTLRIVTR